MLPAHAGMILRPMGTTMIDTDVTRTRGDDPDKESAMLLWDKCYPHTRG